MNSKIEKEQCYELTVDKILGIQDEIEKLIAKSSASMASPTSVARKVQKVTKQLLAALDKILEVGRDLNAMTSCMLDTADDAQAADVQLDHVRRVLAWAGWTGDLTSDVVDAADDVICGIQDLIELTRGQSKGAV